MILSYILIPFCESFPRGEEMKKLTIIAAAVSLTLSGSAFAAGHGQHGVYADFPVTTNYSGSKKTSVSYTGQMARHTLHNSLKKLSSSGDAAKMKAYYGKKDGRAILSPKSKDGFPIKQSTVDEISKGKDLRGKTYKGNVPGWPGNMTGPEVIDFMIEKAAASDGGYDPVNGYNYTQLISKTLMGAVFYNQAVDNYLDEKLEANNKPNDKPYKKGAAYSGKEHVWDEGWGYFGAPAHVLSLDPKTVYNIAKQKKGAFKAADANGDGKVDLVTEMSYAHAYYAAGADKGGKTDYLHTISKAFLDGRKLIASANGKKLTDSQRNQLKSYASVIESNWEKVIAEAAYKYAGSVYGDIKKMTASTDYSESAKLLSKYLKHWGELKGFALALQMGKSNLGGTATELNDLIGMGPVMYGNTQVTGIDGKGNYIQSKSISMENYMGNMIKVQALLGDKFNLKAKPNTIGESLSALNARLKAKETGEND